VFRLDGYNHKERCHPIQEDTSTEVHQRDLWLDQVEDYLGEDSLVEDCWEEDRLEEDSLEEDHWEEDRLEEDHQCLYLQPQSYQEEETTN
jgi:hypothetical protein